MTPDEAYAVLREHLVAATGEGSPVAEAWTALDAALRGDGALPYPWERLTLSLAAERTGRVRGAWWSLVQQGYGPRPDGSDVAGRAFWHPATIDAYLSGDWTPATSRADVTPRRTASRDTWARFAAAHDVTVPDTATRSTIIRACEEAEVL